MKHEPTSILVFRNGSIGNTLAAVPALRAIHATSPSAQLTVVVDSVGRELLEHCPWINHFIVYDKRGRDRSLAAQIRLVRELRRVRPSHAVLFKRFFRNGLLALLSGAPVRAGFTTEGRGPFLNLTVPYEEAVSVVDLNLKLAAAIGAKSAGRELELFLSDEDQRRAADVIRGIAPSGHSFVVAHYGGLTTPPDFLPPKRFAELLSKIAPDETIVLIGHGDAETSTANTISRALPRARSLCGLPLRVSAALIQQSRLFVGFNSGPAQLAAAVHSPEIILYRPDARVADEIRKWCPPSEVAHPLVPPSSTNDQEWSAFLNNAHSISARYTARTDKGAP